MIDLVIYPNDRFGIFVPVLSIFKICFAFSTLFSVHIPLVFNSIVQCPNCIKFQPPPLCSLCWITERNICNIQFGRIPDAMWWTDLNVLLFDFLKTLIILQFKRFVILNWGVYKLLSSLQQVNCGIFYQASSHFNLLDQFVKVIWDIPSISSKVTMPNQTADKNSIMFGK